MQMSNADKTVPVWEKYSLNIPEAAEYYGIGEKKLRQIANENVGAILFWKLAHIFGLREDYLRSISIYLARFKGQSIRQKSMAKIMFILS